MTVAQYKFMLRSTVSTGAIAEYFWFIGGIPTQREKEKADEQRDK